MAEYWQPMLQGRDKTKVEELAARRRQLGLVPSLAETIRAAVELALSADDETLTAGTLQ